MNRKEWFDFYFGQQENNSYAVQGLNTPIPHYSPHYTDERFRNAQLVWGTEDLPKTTWVYSDRMWEWDYDKMKKAGEYACKLGLESRTAAFDQARLQFYNDNPNIRLVGIMAGYNWATGYPYQVFGYIIPEEIDGKESAQEEE